MTNLVKQLAEKLSAASEKKDLQKMIRLMILPKKVIERDEEIFATRPSKFYMMKDYIVINKHNK